MLTAYLPDALAGICLPQDPDLVLCTVSLSFHGLWVWLSQRLTHHLAQICEVTSSYHLVGKFLDPNGVGRFIEVQVRTKIQHYWATALEVVDLFTGRALKSNQGTSEWRGFFIEMGFQFEAMDQINLFHKRSKTDQYESYIRLLRENKELADSNKRLKNEIKRIKVRKKLDAFNNSIKHVDQHISDKEGYARPDSYCLVRIDIEKRQIKTQLFSTELMLDAEQQYIEMEKMAALENNTVVALVASDAVDGIKEAYPNFFANMNEFLDLLQFIENS